MEQLTLEGIVDGAYKRAKVDVEQPDVVAVTRALLGPDAIVRGPRPLHAPACLFRVDEAKWRIVVGRSVPRELALFFVGHELGHWLLREAGMRTRDAEEERRADYIGAALLAPRTAFRSALRSIGPDLPALAEIFETTETGAALRIGEVTGQPLAVIAPQRVRVRGPEEWAWPDERTLRQWARRPAPGLRKTQLTDDPRRVVLDVEDVG